MPDAFKFELVSPERLLVSGQVEQVLVPGAEGDMTVLAYHAPLLTTLRPGVLDIGLPVMDGSELAARLRRIPGLDKLPLIAVTGYGQASDRERAIAAGFDHHLVKPVDVDALAHLTRRAFAEPGV